ncbi:MAG: tRNA guanosine(34) transglycosylase Tgt [Acidobacteriota bacterium]
MNILDTSALSPGPGDAKAPGTFTVQATDGPARLGELHTAHGVVRTPAFMPVGTVGTVKSLCPQDLKDAGSQIILGNTYHLYLRPGDELVARRGGLHKFMGWDGPILTDSGGYQVFSLSELRKLKPDGVEFRSHLDGSKHFFTPEKVLDIQRNLGSDIMMVLDECVPYGADHAYTEKSLDLTHAWAARSRQNHEPGRNGQMVFGIVQGGFFKDLRAISAEAICSMGFEGHAIGGLSVGESTAEMYDLMAHTAPLLPAEKPRYLMGVGKPLDILEGIANGIDMFDCVLPTRNARNGTLYTSQGQVNIKRVEYREDDSPLDPQCTCYTCRTFSKAYLCHLFRAQELLSYRLNTIHNVHFFLELTRGAREAIAQGRYAAYKSHFQEVFAPRTAP